MIREECDRRVAGLEASADRARSLDLRLSWARLVLFVVAAALAGRAAFVPQLGWRWFFATTLVFCAIVVWHTRVAGRRKYAERGVAHYRRIIERLEHRWVGKGMSGAEFADPEHPYASDLDLFGRGSLFERLSSVRTPSGAKTLAGWLLAAAEPEEILRRQQAIAELRDRPELRENLAVVGDDVDQARDAGGLATWAEADLPSAAPALGAIAAVLGIANIATLVLGLTGRGAIPFLVSVALSVVFSFFFAGRTRRTLAEVERRLDELRLLTPLLAAIECERFRAPYLLELHAALAAQGEAPSTRIARLSRIVQTAESRRNLLFAPLVGLLLLGPQLALAVERWRKHHGRSVRRWVDAVGRVEALASIAGYAWERPEDPFPELVAEGPCFAAEGLAHPLLAPGTAIGNAVPLEGDLRLLLVSGSNMSGKSTLLRAVGVNAVLAAAGAPVCARRLRLSPLAVGASMRIVDSLQDGTSHFYAEIRRLARLVEIGRGSRPLLFLLDELLHGTNSHDRRVGAEAILRGLVDGGAIGLVTTHDLALAAIADALAPRAANVHFADRIEGAQVTFDYLLHPGTVTHSNALALMRAVGLDVG
jgi:hypothetical protein